MWNSLWCVWFEKFAASTEYWWDKDGVRVCISKCQFIYINPDKTLIGSLDSFVRFVASVTTLNDCMSENKKKNPKQNKRKMLASNNELKTHWAWYIIFASSFILGKVNAVVIIPKRTTKRLY